MNKQLKETKSKSKNITKQIVLWLWILFGVCVGSIALVFTLIGVGAIGYVPPVEDLQNPIDKYASLVYSSDGVLLGTYSQDKNNRIYSDFSDLSPYLVQALIATEDARFESHSGIDIYALGRALVKTGLLRQESGGGGSTISQQLAKQLYSRRADNAVVRLLQKPVEWVIAVRLEKHYTKEEIINLYLNQFDFLYNAVGIQSAAQVYFNKKPMDLTIEEAATLVGMCKNPSYFNPIRRKEVTRGRRNVVLEQMQKSDFLTKSQVDSLQKTPLALDFKKSDHKEGLAPYFREYLRLTLNAKKPEISKYGSWQKEQYSYDSLQWETNPLYGWCNKNKKADGSNYSLGTDGLKIYATIDSRMQEYAEYAIDEQMSKKIQPLFTKEKKGRDYAPFAKSEAKNMQDILNRAMKRTERYRVLHKKGLTDKDILTDFKKPTEMKVFTWKGEVDTIMSPMDSMRYHMGFLRSGLMAMDTKTGHVKAYVGGIDFKYFQYDMVNLGRRQVGSTMKPFLYTLSMEEGMTPCNQMLHEQQVLYDENGNEWIPKNPPRRVGEMVSIKWGLQNSDNWVTAYLMKQTSPYTFVRTLRSFGITGKIDPVVSMALGTHDISIAEMTAAYTAFANRGIRTLPIYVTHIEDSYGNIVGEFTPTPIEVFGEKTHVQMLDMLESVVDGGTGRAIREVYKIQGQMGAKTGTTQNNSDGWFMAFTPNLSVGTWVGGEEMSIRFDYTRDGQGAATALPITGLFLKKVYSDPTLIDYKSTERFDKANIPPCQGFQDQGYVEETPTQIDQAFN